MRDRLKIWPTFLLVNILFFLIPGFAQQRLLGTLQSELNLQTNIDGIPYKCGLPIMAEAYAKDPGRAAEIVAQYRGERLQKTTDTIISPSGRFVIEYNPNTIPTYDRNSDGTPDYLEFVAKSFDRAWEVEIDSLGFRVPPDQNGQPKSTYRVSCLPLGGNLYGSTLFDSNRDISALPGLNFTSEIEINTNFSFVDYPAANGDPIVRDSMAIAVTAAHEFNHAIQLGYRFWSPSENVLTQISDLRFIEGSATYMEEVVADRVNDYYQYLRSFYRRTDRHWGDDDVLYGDVIFYIMTGEIYGKTITREIWEEILNRPALEAMDFLFREKGSNLPGELLRLAAWMFFSGQNSIAGQFFDEAPAYPNPDVAKVDVLTLNSTASQLGYADELAPLAFHLLEIPLIAVSGGVTVAITPQNRPAAWLGGNLFFTSPYVIDFPGNVFTEISFTPPEQNVFVAVVSGNWSSESDTTMPYEVRFRSSAALAEEGIFAYPNLIRPEEIGFTEVTFINLPENATVEIFNANGIRVAAVRPLGSGRAARWDLRNMRGDFVNTGVYIYRVASASQSQTGKLLIIQ